MSLDIPFNRQPYSTSVKTTSYTIPSDSYARVIPTDFTSDFEIDSVIAIPKVYYSGSASASSTGTKFTNTSNYTLEGTIWISSTDANVNGVVIHTQESGVAQNQAITTLNTSTYIAKITMAPDDFLEVTTTDATETLNWDLQAKQTHGSPNEFWVPPSTALDGTRYVVELFYALS